MSISWGAYAAALSPRAPDGSLDLSTFHRHVQTLALTSLKGVAVNGATGEFCRTSAAELPLLIEGAKRFMPRGRILCGIGSASLAGSLALGRVAIRSQADALLLPVPYFFPYRQDDAIEFVSAVARELEAPILLYNLPQFTTGLAVETVLALLDRHENLVGVKDSSGSLDILCALTRMELPVARLMGNDSALCDAVAERICDGVISGVACVLPELIAAIFEQAPETERWNRSRTLLEEFIARISVLPIPWGLRVTGALRGLGGSEMALPLSPARLREIAALESWFRGWIESIQIACGAEPEAAIRRHL